MYNVLEKSILQLQSDMAAGVTTSEEITLGYLQRIAALDQDGPKLNSVLEINPDAVFTARAMDRERRLTGARGSLHGIPVLLKETVDAFERAVAKKKPLVLVCHVPLCTTDIHQSSCGWTGGKHDQLTVNFVERVRREPLVKAILAGHIHERKESRFSDTAVEFVADALFNGAAQEIVIK